MSTALYEEGLRHATPLQVRSRGGAAAPLPLHRWMGVARGADATLLTRCHGRVLDVGCGPGRLAAELAARGVDCLGIDTSPAACAMTRLAGARARLVSVFDLELTEHFDTVLLADGNIGIGGNPQSLLECCRDHLLPGGSILVELAPPGTRSHTELVRLESGRRAGAWFPWSHLAAPDVHAVADLAGLEVASTWDAADAPSSRRFFASLTQG